MNNKEQFNIVITGHVDHGKSSIIGRLLADTHSLPEGKLENIRAYCEKNAKNFEYAFLLDSLKEEQSQGITIDTCRVFFKTGKRDYLIIDAPGHMEFLKNMITGAAKASAALIVIDVQEGIQENSKRHGYLISLLGIKQIAVLVNKMDLTAYSRESFQDVVKEYGGFLEKIGLKAESFIPVCARYGENIAVRSANLGWFSGPTVIEQIDGFKEQAKEEKKPFRFPVQDVYKFTDGEDTRRIIAGQVACGGISEGDEVVFFPSNKKSRIKTIEFNPAGTIQEGVSCGFTLEDDLYIKPGEIMAGKAEKNYPQVGRKIEATLFWMGNIPLVRGKKYIAKIGTAKILVQLREIINIIDSSELTELENKDHIDRYDVSECVLEADKPFAFDTAQAIESTGRFVIIDNYEICGAGVIIKSRTDGSLFIEEYIKDRERVWDFSFIKTAEREIKNSHKSKFVLITGERGAGKREVAKYLEKKLFEAGMHSYYLGIKSIIAGLDSDLRHSFADIACRFL